MRKYLFTFIFVLFSFFNVCEAHYIPIVRINYLQYSLDVEHYEIINEQDYYMYIEATDMHTKDICVLHILTDKKQHKYTVTDSFVYYSGIVKSYKEYETGSYNDSSVIGKAISILDKIEDEGRV